MITRKAPRWVVQHLNWDAKRPSRRFFTDEGTARLFYRSLASRRNLPAEQSIGREEIPVAIEDLLILRVTKHSEKPTVWAVRLRVGKSRSIRLLCQTKGFRDYTTFRNALISQTGYALPKDRYIGEHAWRVFIRRVMDGERSR